MRIATYNSELKRDGPGLLLRDIVRGEDPQVAAVVQMIASVQPDILVLQNVDYDLELRALLALRAALADAGVHYGTVFARRPNTGRATGLDMDGDGRLGEPEDTHGFAAFAGQGGMAVLSRYPVMVEGVQDFTALLWRDIPNALLPIYADGTPFPDKQAQAALRLGTVAQWAVPIRHPTGPITLLTFHANPPVFDGPEDRNGRRNHDQLRFWRHYMDGTFGSAPEQRFVVLGHANQDPVRGEGIKAGIGGLLADPRLQDPKPARPGMVDAPYATVHWPRVTPSIQRVSYVLPSRDWQVADSGVYWPMDDPRIDIASRHRIVWVDLLVD
ncbi:endonuclease/exonuclease/phosphatase family protein [Rhodobacteraceae bacterium KMM 6894]|nr:endonuclease/exonuclease/phosphatase family protein [Rhodobacteraceae bacterium KMM 6894]